MAKIHVSTTVNGEPTEFLCEPQQTLLDVLRDELRLTGSKEGCATGDCGACSVTLDGRLICSCLALGAEALASFDAEQGAWVAEAGEFEIRVGASSRDIRQRTPLRLL